MYWYTMTLDKGGGEDNKQCDNKDCNNYLVSFGDESVGDRVAIRVE